MVEFSWPVRVYYEDTDAGGIVYHASYIRFFERARTEQLRSFGVTQQSLLNDQIGFVVRDMSVSFIRPAVLDQQLMLINQISSVKRTSIIFDQTIIDEKQQLICKAQVVVVCVDILKMKPKGIPPMIMTEITSAR